MSARPSATIPSQQAKDASSAPRPSRGGDDASLVLDSVEGDVELERARDLLRLHATVKVANTAGLDRALGRAREDVERVLRFL